MTTLMRFIAFTMLIGLAFPAFGEVGEDDAKIKAVITRQLEAFQAGNGVAAFEVASPMIQMLFGDAARFLEVVEQGYPQIAHARSHKFLNRETVGTVVVQRVLVASDKGSVVARYEMIQINDGWRVNGCQIEAQQDASIRTVHSA